MKLDNFEKAFVRLGKKWLTPGDNIDAALADWDYNLDCQCGDDYTMRLFLSVRPHNTNLKWEVVKMWTFDDEKQRWFDESRYASECWFGDEHVVFHNDCLRHLGVRG